MKEKACPQLSEEKTQWESSTPNCKVAKYRLEQFIDFLKRKVTIMNIRLGEKRKSSVRYISNNSLWIISLVIILTTILYTYIMLTAKENKFDSTILNTLKSFLVDSQFLKFHTLIWLALIFITVFFLYEKKRDIIIKKLFNSYKMVWLSFTIPVTLIIFKIILSPFLATAKNQETSHFTELLTKLFSSSPDHDLTLTILSVIIAIIGAFAFKSKKGEELLLEMEDMSGKFKEQLTHYIIMPELNQHYTAIANLQINNNLESNKKVLSIIKKIDEKCKNLDISQPYLKEFINKVKVSQAIALVRLFVTESKGTSDVKNNIYLEELFYKYLTDANAILMSLTDKENSQDIRKKAYSLLVWLYNKLPDDIYKKLPDNASGLIYSDVESICADASAKGCNHYNITYYHARNALSKHNYRKAISLFKKTIITVDEMDENPRAVHHLYLGDAYSRIYETQKAEDAYNNARRLAPHNSAVYRKLGLLIAKREAKNHTHSEHRLQYIAKSVEYFKIALNIDYHNTKTHVRYGEALYKQGYYNSAIMQFDFVNSLAPQCSTAFLYKGLSKYYKIKNEEVNGSNTETNGGGKKQDNNQNHTHNHKQQATDLLRLTLNDNKQARYLVTFWREYANQIQSTKIEDIIKDYLGKRGNQVKINNLYPILRELIKADVFLSHKKYKKTANDFRMHAAAKFYIYVCLKKVKFNVVDNKDKTLNEFFTNNLKESYKMILRQGLEHAQKAIKMDKTFSTAYHYYGRIAGKLALEEDTLKKSCYFSQSVAAFKYALITNACNKTTYYAKAMMHLDFIDYRLVAGNSNCTNCNGSMPTICKLTLKDYLQSGKSREDNFNYFKKKNIKEFNFCCYALNKLEEAPKKRLKYDTDEDQQEPNYINFIKEKMTRKLREQVEEVQSVSINPEIEDSEISQQINEFRKLIKQVEAKDKIKLSAEDKRLLERFFQQLNSDKNNHQ